MKRWTVLNFLKVMKTSKATRVSKVDRLSSLSAILVVAVLAGCSSAPDVKQVEPKVQPSVKPIPIVKRSIIETDASLALADLLIQHYLNAPSYKMNNPTALAQYRSNQTSFSADGKQLLQLYQSGAGWGFISVSTGYQPVVNMFEVIDGEQTRYALVLKEVKICLVAGADRAPQWQGVSLRHSVRRPGNFECSGQTRGSLFRSDSGMPVRLGVYFESGDTVLYDANPQRLERIAALLAKQFNHLRIPEGI